MTFRSSLIMCAALLACGTQAQDKLGAILNPVADRISDQAIFKDQKTYEDLQLRLNSQKLSIKGLDYAIAKSQCWLDVSFHEYHRNDRTAFPQAALSESEKIVAGLEAGRSNVGTETPLVDNADRLREDLWGKASLLKGARGFSCAAAATACMEVYLVQAGHEHRQFGMAKHTPEVIAQAEEMAAEAQRQSDNCPQPGAVSPPVAVPARGVENVVLGADALFKFDQYQRQYILPEGRARIDEMLAKVRAQYVTISAVHLVGHTDRLGSVAYNQRLSERRAATIKAYLVEAGLPASTITTEGRGESDPVKTSCVGEVATRALTDCLQPNRRVDFRFEGVRKP